MKSSPALAAVLALAAAPMLAPTISFAQDAAAAACTAPVAPAIPDGKTADITELKAAMDAVKAFLAASDAYQQCEIDSVTAQRAAAKTAGVKFDEGLAKSAQARVAANQKAKEDVGAKGNAAVKAYKAAHPA